MSTLPYWPAAMDKKMAAAYCGISTKTFNKICPVRPISITGSVSGERYLRQRIDEWLISIDSTDQVDRPDLKPSSKSSVPVQQTSQKARSAVPEPRGWPISDDKNDPMMRWYKRVGFDPRTMTDADMDRLLEKEWAKWASDLSGKPLGKLERATLEQLGAHGANVSIPFKDIGCGPSTLERLMVRGFVETSPSKKFPDRVGYLVLTGSGYAAWQKVHKDRTT